MLAALPSRHVPQSAIVAACVAGLVGAAMHVYEYYSSSQLSGNYYAWFLTGPFIVALIIIAFQAAKRPASLSKTD
jgi:ABC-type Co2+ transport system permease subunit